MDIIGNARGFSGKTPIAPSRGFSVETLTRATPSWKTELNRSISAMEDGISGGLQHRPETCCEKGGRCGRWAYMVQKWFHCGDVVFRQVDLYITEHKINHRVRLSRCVRIPSGDRISRSREV